MAEAGTWSNSLTLSALEQRLTSFGLSKKDRRRKEFLDISDANLAIAEELVAEMRKLSEKGQTKEFNRLAAITKRILDNNAKFQAVVGEVLSDIK